MKNCAGLGIPTYFDFIEKAMDLTTMGKNLKKSIYCTPQRFADDYRLIVQNAQKFNRDGEPVYQFAGELGAMFEKEYQALLDHLQKEKEARREEKKKKKLERKRRKEEKKKKKKSKQGELLA